MDERLHRFKKDVSAISLPLLFDYPHYYQPHEIALYASDQLQGLLQENLKELNHNFGIEDPQSQGALGKMFGVLVVKDEKGQLGFLAAFSGKLGESNHHLGFVPPIYDMLKDGSYFMTSSDQLNYFNSEIDQLESSNTYQTWQSQLLLEVEHGEKILKDHRSQMKERKNNRKKARSILDQLEKDDNNETLKQQLVKESLRDQYQYKKLVKELNRRQDQLRQKIEQHESDINALKQQRKDLSNEVQQYLFNQYRLLNGDGQEKTVGELFKDLSVEPPAGTGDCAAPKLLQYAFQNCYQPIAMAEFWWGKSPDSKIRKHRRHYPACRSKCEPLLEWMLQGVPTQPNPLLTNVQPHGPIRMLYEDEYLAVISKPAELLSVPGKNIKDSVQTRMKLNYPDVTGPLVVHRLDMSTSGIMLVAKSEEIYKNLQRQFIKKTIHKVYTAILEGRLPEERLEGHINLPLRVDLDNRPHQLVCYDHGKSARTHYKVIGKDEKSTRISFSPITGRTHQLRVHSAHKDGLGLAIKGDDLYGQKADRLYLHATTITFVHPITLKEMTVVDTCPF